MFKASLSNKEYTSKTLFYDDVPSSLTERDAYALTSAKLSFKAGTAGSFEFAVPPSNILYDKFEKLSTYISLYRNDERIFYGRVYSETKDFDGISNIICEGILAILNDTIVRPATYNDTLSNLVSAFITSHNEQVGADKRIVVGNITVSDDYVYREYENYETTMTRINDLVDSYGGYISLTKEKRGEDAEEKLYFDWIASITYNATQTIDLGTNLTDLSQESTADDLFSVIIPLGKEIEASDGSKAKLTIAGVPTDEGWHTVGTDYIEFADAIAEMGRIVKVVEWNDVTDATNLYNKAKSYLTDQSRSRVSISVSAVDMAMAGSTIEAWKIAEKIKVNAKMFGVDGVYLDVLEQDLDLQNPANSKMTLGSTEVGYIKKSSLTQNTTDKHLSNIDKVANGNTKSINNLSDRINEDLHEITKRVETNENWINSSEATIEAGAKKVVEEYDYDEKISSIQRSAVMQLDAEKIKTTVEKVIGDGSQSIATWMQFDFDGLTIGRSNSKVKSIQDNDSYIFKDSDSDKVLLEINTDGVEATTVTAESQLKLKNGSVDQWAIRNGVSDSGYANMNFVWIGGSV